MSVATRIENISNNLENAYNSLEGLGINLNGINKNIENLSDVIDDIYNEWPKTSGEDTELKFDATKEGRITFELKGQAIQSKTTGKNLLKITPPTDAGYKKGINTIYDNTTGEIKISGTTTNSYPWLSDSQVETIPSETNLVFSTLTLKNYKIYARLYASDETYETLTLNANTKQTTITTTKDIIRIGILTDTATGITLNDSLYLQLETGTSGTDYEPYTAKQVAPNPDYPQDIKIVNHENVIKIIGKNLFDKNNVNFLRCWPTGVELASGSNMCYWIPCSPNTTYSVQKIMIVPNSQNRMAIATTETRPILHTPVIDRVNLGDNKTEGTITTSSKAHYLLIVVANTDSQPETTEEQILNSIQIEKNSAPTAYEEYKSQTYPINLGTQNLFNPNIYGQLIQNEDFYKGTYTIENDNLKIVTTGNDSYIPSMSNYNQFTYHRNAAIKVKPNTTYTFSFDSTAKPSGRYYIYEGDSNYQGIKQAVNPYFNYKNKVTFTTSNTTEYIIIRFAIWESATIIFSHLQLEEGDTQHEYTKYGAQILELCQINNYKDEIFKGTGKNLFDSSFITSQTKNGVVLTNNNGLITISGTTTAATHFSYSITNETLNLVQGQTYTLSIKGTSTGIDNLGLKKEASLNKLVILTINEATSITKTITETVLDYNNFDIWIPSGHIVNARFYIQLELGNQVTPYEPYGKIWYLNKQIGKSILDGSESYSLLATLTNVSRYTANNVINAKSSSQCYSNYFTWYSNQATNEQFNAVDNEAIHIRGDSVGIGIKINTSTASTTNELKTWLSTHNTIVYYVLSTPTYEEITDSDLKTQLEQLYKAKSYNNITNIIQENDNAPFIIKADALLQISD